MFTCDFRKCGIICFNIALLQVTLTMVHHLSMGTPVHQSRTRPSPMVTSAKTAPFTHRRQTPSSHSLHPHHHHYFHLRLQKLRPTSCPRPRHLSQVYIPETGVEGPRLVRKRQIAVVLSQFFFVCLFTYV